VEWLERRDDGCDVVKVHGLTWVFGSGCGWNCRRRWFPKACCRSFVGRLPTVAYHVVSACASSLRPACEPPDLD
jgi:hypothetical protein